MLEIKSAATNVGKVTTLLKDTTQITNRALVELGQKHHHNIVSLALKQAAISLEIVSSTLHTVAQELRTSKQSDFSSHATNEIVIKEEVLFAEEGKEENEVTDTLVFADPENIHPDFDQQHGNNAGQDPIQISDLLTVELKSEVLDIVDEDLEAGDMVEEDMEADIDETFQTDDGVPRDFNHRMGRKCGKNCVPCRTPPCRVCTRCKSKRRCELRKCEFYLPKSAEPRKCDDCLLPFSNLRTMRRHKLGNCSASWTIQVPLRCTERLGDRAVCGVIAEGSFNMREHRKSNRHFEPFEMKCTTCQRWLKHNGFLRHVMQCGVKKDKA